MASEVKVGQVWGRKKDGFSARVTEVLPWRGGSDMRVYLKSVRGATRVQLWDYNLRKYYDLIEETPDA